MYYVGQGVAQDYAEAYFWMDLAAAAGDKDAPKVHDRAAEFLTPEQPATAKPRAKAIGPSTPSRTRRSDAGLVGRSTQLARN